MTIEPGNSGSKPGLIGRVMGLALRPKDEWAVIDGEGATVQGLFTGHVMILAAIPAVMGLLASMVMGLDVHRVLGVSLGLSPAFYLTQAVLSYIVSLIGVYVFALLIDALAPSFGAEKDRLQAMKVAAYTPTVMWASSVALIVPLVGGLVVLTAAIYTIFFFHWGLSRLMRAPEDKAVGYTAVTIIVGIIASFLISFVVNLPLGVMRTATIFGGKSPNVTINLNGVKGSVNVEEAARTAEKLADQIETSANGSVAATDPAVLQTLLPASLPGFTRNETSSGGGGIGAMNASSARGVYQKGDGRIELTVTDLGALGAMTSIVRVNTSKETPDGYEKVATVDGRMSSEEYHRASRSGKYQIIVSSRFSVEADGDKVTMDEIKAAVSAVPVATLESMARG